MKYRYLIVLLDGTEPTGTDNRELAQKVAETEEQGWVIDTDTGMTLDEDPVDIDEEDASDWLDDSSDQGDDEDSDKELD